MRSSQRRFGSKACYLGSSESNLYACMCVYTRLLGHWPLTSDLQGPQPVDCQVQTGVREGDGPPADEEVPHTAGLGECEGEGRGV